MPSVDNQNSVRPAVYAAPLSHKAQRKQRQAQAKQLRSPSVPPQPTRAAPQAPSAAAFVTHATAYAESLTAQVVTPLSNRLQPAKTQLQRAYNFVQAQVLAFFSFVAAKFSKVRQSVSDWRNASERKQANAELEKMATAYEVVNAATAGKSRKVRKASDKAVVVSAGTKPAEPKEPVAAKTEPVVRAFSYADALKRPAN